VGQLLPGEPPIYVGIYVDDIIYFSPSDRVEEEFASKLSSIGDVDFMGQVAHFLGIEFTWKYSSDGHLSVTLTQQSFIEALLDSLKIQMDSTSHFTSPYRSGMSVDMIPHRELSSSDRDQLRLQYQSIIGSLNWLAHASCPDLSTIVSLLAQHQCNPLPGHLDGALYATKYLSTTKTLSIYFTAIELPLFAPHSMSAFYIDLLGPLHWLSCQQTVTAGSSAEVEIYATDECVKFLLELSQILEFLDLKHLFMPSTNTMYNNNQACVNWSKHTTTKGLCHIQMKEN